MLPFWAWILVTFSIFGLIFLFSKKIRDLLISSNHEHNDFLDPSQQLLGLIYGVLLAFVVVFSWQGYTNLSNNLDSEAIGLFDLWRDVEVFEDKVKIPLQDAIQNYLDSILTYEWKLMKKGIRPSINPAYSNILKTVEKLDAHTEIQKAFLTNLVSEMNSVNMYRRARIVSVTGSTPSILWIFLVAGAVCILTLTGFYNVSRKLYLFLCSLQTFILVFSFYLISNFNHPFQGALAVKGEVYKNVLETMVELRKQDLN